MHLEGIEPMHIILSHKGVILLTSHANHYAISSELVLLLTALPNLVQYIHTMAATKDSFEDTEKQRRIVGYY